MTGPDDASLRLAAEATLRASRALLGVVAWSVAEALEVVTPPQFRVLVLLSAAGPSRIGALAEQLGVTASTFTRTADRLEQGGWVRREESPGSRREVFLAVTDAGRALVDRATARRLERIEAILGGLEEAERTRLRAAFDRFAQAAGEPAIEPLPILR